MALPSPAPSSRDLRRLALCRPLPNGEPAARGRGQVVPRDELPESNTFQAHVARGLAYLARVAEEDGYRTGLAGLPMPTMKRDLPPPHVRADHPRGYARGLLEHQRHARTRDGPRRAAGA